MIHEKYCVIDIECWTPTGEPDPTKDELRYVGFKSWTGAHRIYKANDVHNIQSALNNFAYYVGHNISDYDIPILQRHGFSTPGRAIDTYNITVQRAKPMMHIDFNKGDMSLKKLCEFFKLQYHKGEFDYALLKEVSLSKENEKLLTEYLIGDLDCADALFKFYYGIFEGFRDLVSAKDRRLMSWLTSSAGATAYKCICNMTGIPEIYEEVEESNSIQYEGAFVSDPEVEYVEGDIYCYDFTSLYPHMFIGGNLYSINDTDNVGWTGTGIYPSVFINDVDGINGEYKHTQGKVEKLLHRLFMERKQIPKSDPRNLAYKIILNTSYGISGNRKFKSLFNLTTASDCTAMARRSIKHARTVLQKEGYKVLYTDTDSCYVLDTYNKEKKLEDLCDYISNVQKASFNIPVETHKFTKECRIKRMHFFKDDTGNFIKKHYMYVKDNDSVTMKGMQVIKGSASPLAKLIAETYIKPMLIKGQMVVLPYDSWHEIFQKEAAIHPEFLIKRYRVWPIETYKGGEEATGLHAQIAKRYGKGEHWLVINTKIGPGKGNHYAKLEELKDKYRDEWIKVVKLNEYMKDIREFIYYKDRKKLK